MNKYEEMKNRHEKKVNDFPMQFAFSEEQFDDGMKKLGLTKDDKDKIVKIGDTRGFIRKSDLEDFNKMWEEIDKEKNELISEDKTGEGFIKDMFKYELINHEYSYTYELDDTLNALGFTYEQVMKNPALKNGLELAKKELLSKTRTLNKDELLEFKSSNDNEVPYTKINDFMNYIYKNDLAIYTEDIYGDITIRDTIKSDVVQYGWERIKYMLQDVEYTNVDYLIKDDYGNFNNITNKDVNAIIDEIVYDIDNNLGDEREI